ncbi:hypothetical protein B0T11DRAFT_332815 [Plectosphaerella cucumerina]|uniref:Uncharacterized protein n=1 Tax=Plectosphaerella cucumerina TaxID=40658 RepID=A0A8K0WYT3_9PEZI|nr:hypothetical protein B0T11DRAFT_332815 [Plectosphaerella cucumerina]
MAPVDSHMNWFNSDFTGICNICSLAKQKCHDCNVAFVSGQLKRRASTGSCLAHSCAIIEQQFQHIRVTGQNRHMNGLVASFVRCVDIGAALEKKLDSLQTTLKRRLHQCSIATAAFSIDVGASHQKCFQYVDMTSVCRCMDRLELLGANGRYIHPMVKQHCDHSQTSTSCSFSQWRKLVTLLGYCRLRIVVQKELHDIWMACMRCKVDGRVTRSSCHEQISPLLQQQSGYIHMAVLRGCVKWCDTITSHDGIDSGPNTAIEEKFDNLHRTYLRSLVKRASCAGHDLALSVDL